MLLLSSQFSSPAHSSLESALAALQDVSQLLSEDLDRSNEACNQFWQKSAESSWQTYSELFACKEPQDFFMVSSAHLKFCLEQGTLLQNTLNNIVQDAGQKYQELVKQTLNLPQASIFISSPNTPTVKVTANPLELIIDRHTNTQTKPVATEVTTPIDKPAAKRKTSSSTRAPSATTTTTTTTKTIAIAKPAVKKPSFPTVPGREPVVATSKGTTKTTPKTPIKAATKTKRAVN